LLLAPGKQESRKIYQVEQSKSWNELRTIQSENLIYTTHHAYSSKLQAEIWYFHEDKNGLMF
jgi:hypothetical protein